MSKKAWMIVIAWLAFLLVVFGAAYVAMRVTPANAETTKPTVQNVTLGAGQQLKSTEWHCSPAGYCELWYLTKPRKQGEPPVTYDFSSADGTRKYIIKEQ